VTAGVASVAACLGKMLEQWSVIVRVMETAKLETQGKWDVSVLRVLSDQLEGASAAETCKSLQGSCFGNQSGLHVPVV
jgi:hypothetical protein